jgi:threonine dehydrogenase-like Zn-dependent dehydrogenase
MKPCRAEPASLAALVENEIELHGARGGGITDAIGLLARAQIDVLPLITRRMRLADGPAIIQAASAPEQIKVVVEI